jgi:hypothetical protein
MTRILRFILRCFLYLIVLLLFIVFLQYITCPVYEFSAGKSFSGKRIYNPYRDMDSNQWIRANFQVQSRAWLGLTDGRKNSSENIHELYKALGYQVIAISDYQKINRFEEGKEGYIPVYEHGYNIQKFHQVLIGSGRVLWRDYVFFQTRHHKQHLLQLLRSDNDLVALAHPRFTKGFSPVDLKYLSGYDCIEVVNGFRLSPAHWDTALSNGHYATVLGDDDAHDISNLDQIGHRCTYINARAVDRKEVVAMLMSGNAFAADIYRNPGETLEEKITRVKNLPLLREAGLSGDTITIRVGRAAREIRFIGQNGGIRQVQQDTDRAVYLFRPEDTYIRTEIAFPDGTVYYLNPFCRSEGNFPAQTPFPHIDRTRTWLLRSAGMLLLFLLILVGRNMYIARR